MSGQEVEIIPKGKKEAKPKRISHLKYATEIPTDAIPIKTYGKHQFENLFYSPSTTSLYQKYEKRIRQIDTGNDEHGKQRKSYVRSAGGKTIYLSVKKLLKQLQNAKDSKEALTEVKDTLSKVVKEMENENEDKDDSKIRYVKGENKKSQVGVITNAKKALSEAKATKHRSNKVNVNPEDIRL